MASSSNRAFLWWLIGIIGTIGLIFGLAQLGGGPTESAVSAALTINDQDHVMGESTAPVTLVEYSDFQCPACAYYFPILKEVKEKAGAKLRVVYRHFPLRQTHKYAQIAAQAAVAAGNQGKFVEMHDILFDRQRSWPLATDVTKTMKDYAAELELDAARFAEDLDSSATKDRVERDVTSGTSLRLLGTPTFYLNGKAFSTPFTAEKMLAEINQLAP